VYRRMLMLPLVALCLLLSACTVTTTAAEPDAATSAAATPAANRVATPAGRGGVVGVVDRVLPAVVNVVADSDAGRGEGTGFIIRSDGIAVTNYHVVEQAQRLTVITSSKKPTRYPARVIGGDQSKDLAVLKIDATDLPTVAMGDSNSLRLGQEVVAIGYALGLEGGPSVTAGVVSSLNRVVRAQDQNCPPETCKDSTRIYDHVIQTDAAINPGNSGGPLVDLAGNVVGINTAGAGASVADNIGFAIQINAAKQTILDAAENPSSPVAYLGVGSVDASDPQLRFQLDVGTDQGAAVVNVAPGGPAEKAGIQVGDVIVSFDGETVDSSKELGELIHAHDPGDAVGIEVVHPDGSRDDVTVALGTNPLP
jgi:S1-C subfamily serine protease